MEAASTAGDYDAYERARQKAEQLNASSADKLIAEEFSTGSLLSHEEELGERVSQHFLQLATVHHGAPHISNSSTWERSADEEVARMLCGEQELIPEDEAASYHSPQLKNNAVSLEGWLPKNETERSTMASVLSHLVDQRRTIKNNLHSPLAEDEAVTVYDEGWLYAFTSSIPAVQEHPFKSTQGFDQQQLADFVIAQQEYWEKAYKNESSEFHAGAADAFASWGEELRLR